MKRKGELEDRITAQRLRSRNAEFVAGLKGLLGSRPSTVRTANAAEATRLAKEFKAGYESAEPHDWALIKFAWKGADSRDLVEWLHRLSNHLGNRDVWLLDVAEAAQAASIGSEQVLDNPLGFASILDQQVALLDQQVPAGFWLVRHSYHVGESTTYEWELEVWGEPWLSAMTHALRQRQ